MQEHLGQKAKLFNFCSTPKAKVAGAIVFIAVKTAVNVAGGGLSRGQLRNLDTATIVAGVIKADSQTTVCMRSGS